MNHLQKSLDILTNDLAYLNNKGIYGFPLQKTKELINNITAANLKFKELELLNEQTIQDLKERIEQLIELNNKQALIISMAGVVFPTIHSNINQLYESHCYKKGNEPLPMNKREFLKQSFINL